MTTLLPRYSKEDFARRGDEIYERDIRSQLEVTHAGDYIAIDIGVTQLKPFSEGAPSQKEVSNEVNCVTPMILKRAHMHSIPTTIWRQSGFLRTNPMPRSGCCVLVTRLPTEWAAGIRRRSKRRHGNGWDYKCASSASYSACEPIQNQIISSSLRMPTARYSRLMRAE